MTSAHVVVTGAGSGIGRECALFFAARGHAVTAIDVSLTQAEETSRAAAAGSGPVRAAEADVTDYASIDAAIASGAEAFGPVTAAVNSAGIQGELGPLADISLDGWARTIDVNLTGVFHSLRSELNHRAPDSPCSIVNIASNFGILGRTLVAPYVAAKHGVVGLTKAVALDYARDGVRVNAVCPGPVETPLLDRLGVTAGGGGDMLSEVTRSVPMGRLGQPAEIAETVWWLCSPGAAFVTGAVIAVDGGFVAGK